ncbi:EAL domain-containing protein [Kovacikia minuta CCNUW1]|uniref:EAL domain-containing protein n=1 Tax=Kovacikia minuta TaxID=2931930 RepID=UPI001CCC0B0C|nr:EAL domain-containing protein [Kovacikia minuta]UBF24677.1 EAL domain-containing protein [Kovacikia minuta CCNUW1]
MTDFQFSIAGMANNGRRLLAMTLKHPTFVTSILVAGLLLGIRHMGGFQPLELMAFDHMLRLRPDAGSDPRLLIVAITEADIRMQNRWPISDQVMAELLAKLQRFQPSVIGLDVYRDVPQPPGSAALVRQLQANNVIAVRLLTDGENDGVAAPAGVPPARVGFSDILLDPDAVVRRNLLYAKSETEALSSFSLRLSLAYLAKQKIPFQVTPDYLKIGDTVFHPLNADSGGYEGLDDRGYQVLLNYRSASNGAELVTLTQVLTGKIAPEQVRGKIILIGTTAPSAKDLFLTPFNLSSEKSPKTPGVMVHAQMVSQILSQVFDERPSFWFWSKPGEAAWIWAWTLIGGVLAWQLRHPLSLSFTLVVVVGGLYGICLVILLKAGWVPFAPAAIGLIVAGAGVIVYRLLYDTFHDALTGLPNRALFTKRLQGVLHARESSAIPLEKDAEPLGVPAIAVLFLGLDGFKAINDSFGHRLGDQMLVTMTQRLKACLCSGDQLARVGGDEFAVLRREVWNTDEVTQLADQLQQQITQPFKLGGQEVFTSASVGIVLGRANSDYEAEDILRDAHTAMNQAKAAGKARHEVFATGMRVQVINRLQLETDLRRAIDRQEFQLHYQPIVHLKTGKLAGFEALVRWQHPQRGLVPPVEFIPIAEETDLILPLSQWIIKAACHQLKGWQQQFPKEPPLIVSVNFSGRQFSQSDLVEQIEQTLQESNLDGRGLKLEITETTAMTDVESTIALLQRLKSLNLQLSIDDFGTGYSSLSYLHRFPTNTIKVDRSFVSRMGDGSEDAQIVQTIIVLGHNLGMDIVAEGVETAEQLAALRSLGCEYGQGYFFSKPLTVEAAEKLLKADPEW